MVNQLYERGSILLKQENDRLILSGRLLRIEYDLSSGFSEFWQEGRNIASRAFSRAKVSDGLLLNNTEYAIRKLAEDGIREMDDRIGRGIRVSIENLCNNKPSMVQTFYIYEDKPYFFMEIELKSQQEISSNYVAPLVLEADSEKESVMDISNYADERVLFVPFDNDKWIRFESNPVQHAKESYEVTAVFDNQSRNGLIVGSVTHDTWKTGIRVSGDSDKIKELIVYGGAAGEITRDSLPHGMVKGEAITSPRIFIGLFDDYRSGLEEYGAANCAIEPMLNWEEGVPFGWNSWAAVENKLDCEVYLKASEFLKDHLQDKGFQSNGTVYINFDSFWTNLSEEEMKAAVDQVHARGQKAGIYYTPFTFWGRDYDRIVEDTRGAYTYRDLVLKDEHGNILPELDGGIPIDPTHPGNLMRVEAMLNRFIEGGFDYIKLDFMAHGAIEGVHYDKRISTGIQAYNYGMAHIKSLLSPERVGRPFFINLSIAPVFPYQYAHARRISCDAFGSIQDTEYMLNSLTYGWWMNNSLYRYNDPDHTVLFKSLKKPPTTENEAVSRLNASVIAGTVLLLSDDYRMEEARARTEKLLSNSNITRLAQKGMSFRPVEGNTGSAASEFFTLQNGDEFYLAAFNYSDREAEKIINLSRIGLDERVEYVATDLWTGERMTVSKVFNIRLDAAQSRIFSIDRA
ncbi:hypothetical protein V6C42_06395 [Pseudoclostridium thermosuccinogenes]|uniref:alpha-galactosidase n=1 Tax=Clostridium thermosuccinogenes TaxID=84032 RepID=UPI002FD89295